MNFFKIFCKNKHKNVTSRRPLTDEQYNNLRAEKEQILNAILDKIVKHGERSLSKKEIDFLTQYKKNDGKI